MQISAALVKELRERTGAGMMECKKALVAAEGDIERAIEDMRKSGQAKADKRAGRIAAEGLVATAVREDGGVAVIVEVNCETDFVAKEGEFKDYVQNIAQLAMEHRPADLAGLSALAMAPGSDQTVEDRRRELVAKIGENLSVRRFQILESDGGRIGDYLHFGSRIGVLVDIVGGDDDVRKDIAMHVAASKPMCLSKDEVPADSLAKEEVIFKAQAADSGKPAEIVEKMVTGRLRKYVAEITLLGQPFVKDNELSVEKYLKQNNSQARAFVRFEVGEGMAKRNENFAEEVMAQVRDS